MTVQLKALGKEAIGRAIEKAELYRLLDDPTQAESICLDVLDTDRANQEARRVLVLALTDQFAHGDAGGLATRAKGIIAELDDPYTREYMLGLVAERQGRAMLRRLPTAQATYGFFRAALDAYERAEALRPPGNDDPILRWNSCVRTMQAHRLELGEEKSLDLE